VSLIAVSLEQLIYLFLTRCCLLSIPPRTLQRHPCPLGSQNYLNKEDVVEGPGNPRLGIQVKKNRSPNPLCLAASVLNLVFFIKNWKKIEKKN
jgi:hypothetical protein